MGRRLAFTLLGWASIQPCWPSLPLLDLAVSFMGTRLKKQAPGGKFKAQRKYFKNPQHHRNIFQVAKSSVYQMKISKCRTGHTRLSRVNIS